MTDLIHHRKGFLAPPDFGGQMLEQDLWVHRAKDGKLYWIAEPHGRGGFLDCWTFESSDDAIIACVATFAEAKAELEDWLRGLQ